MKPLIVAVCAMVGLCVTLANEPEAVSAPSITMTVDGADYPVCAVEDCSDQPGQLGIWIDSTGTMWLSRGEESVRIVR